MIHIPHGTTSTTSPGPLSAFLNTVNAPPPAELTATTEIITSLRGGLDQLGKMFDALQVQTGYGEMQIAPYIAGLHNQMEGLDMKQEQQIKEIEALFEDVMQTDMVEHLQKLIEAELDLQIDEAVQEQVAALLPEYIPQALLDEIAANKQQLEDLQRALHNSESRYANSLLSTARMGDAVHTICKLDGEVSKLFPGSLQEMFSMDAETAQALMEEYEILGMTESRERNINRIMQFCGITYQLTVRPTGQTPMLSAFM